MMDDGGDVDEQQQLSVKPVEVLGMGENRGAELRSLLARYVQNLWVSTYLPPLTTP